MDQACARFERYLKRRFGQSSTPIHYLNDLKIFINTVGNKEPESITPKDIDSFIEKQLAQCLSAATINRRLATIRSLFEYLAGENPERTWPNPVVPSRHRLKRGSRLPRDVSDEEVTKIFAVINSARDRAMFGLMVGAGLRVGEVASLRLASIEESVDSHHMAKLIVCGKGGQERVVWLTNVLWDTLKAWLEARHQSGVGNVTIQNELVHLRCLLRFLEERDCPVDTEIFRIQLPRKTVNPLPRHLAEADYRWLELNILQATKNDSYDARFDRACFLMLAHTGIRLSEFLDLRLEDIDLGSGYAAIRHSKPDRDRVVCFSPQLKTTLQRYFHLRPNLDDEDRVFVLHGRSPSPRTIQRRLTIYGQQAGIIVSPHILRHTFATRLLNQGIPIHSLRKLLGHKRLDTTQVYAHVYDKTLYHQFQDAMSRLETNTLELQLLDKEQESVPTFLTRYSVTSEGGTS